MNSLELDLPEPVPLPIPAPRLEDKVISILGSNLNNDWQIDETNGVIVRVIDGVTTEDAKTIIVSMDQLSTLRLSKSNQAEKNAFQDADVLSFYVQVRA